MIIIRLSQYMLMMNYSLFTHVLLGLIGKRTRELVTGGASTKSILKVWNKFEDNPGINMQMHRESSYGEHLSWLHGVT